METTVTELRPRQDVLITPNCLLCTHLLQSADDMYCPIFGQRIYFPSVAAEDCPRYDPMEGE